MHVADKLTVGESSIHGVTRLFSMWIPRFDKRQYNVTVCSLRGRDQAGEYLERLGIKVFYLDKGKFDPSTLISLSRLIKDEAVDILHLHGYGAWTFGRPVGRFRTIPVVVHEHMIDRNIPFYQRLADWVLSGMTTRGIAISNPVKEFMIQYRSVPADRMEVVINGTTLEPFNERNDDAQKMAVDTWRTRLNIPANHKVVGTVGRLDAIKGHKYFLQAACEVLQRNRDVTFVVVGDGDLRKSLEEQTRSLGIEGNVRFTGHCHEIVPLYLLMDIVVIASLFEGGPLTLFEAMAAGCAVVSTDTIGLRDVIEEGDTGFLVPSKDVPALANRIGLLVQQDDTLLQNMKAAALSASAGFGVDTTIERLENCYQKVLETR
jgi:glycosyltransferase involved in cell wall biosynthesis